MRGLVKKLFVKGVRAALKDPEIREGIWRAANRPDLERMGRFPPRDPWQQAWENAAKTSAEYVEKHMLTVPVLRDRRPLLDLCLGRIGIEGCYLEFGCGHEANCAEGGRGRCRTCAGRRSRDATGDDR